MKKYRVSSHNIIIHEMEIERETEKSVFFKRGLRESKNSECQRYFDTFKEAHKYLTVRTELQLNNLKRRLEGKESELKELKKMEGKDELRLY